jgi:hypothetical protein
MKQILDNWNQFISEQKSISRQQKLDLFAREKLDLNSIKDDKRWELIKKRAAKYTSTIQKLADSSRKVVYNTYDSTLGEKSFIAMARQKSLGGISSESTDEEILQVYKKSYLPAIKKTLDSVPVVNMSSPSLPFGKEYSEQSQKNIIDQGLEFASQASKGAGSMANGFFSFFPSAGVGYIGIVPYFLMDKQGKLDLASLRETIIEELVHAVDVTMGGTPPESSGVQPSATGEGFFANIFSGDIEKISTEKPKNIPQAFYDYLKNPKEVYAKLKRIKIELQRRGDAELFFDKDGKINLESLKQYLENPSNKERHLIIHILNIQKLGDIGDVLNQIARVSPQNVSQKTSQMA